MANLTSSISGMLMEKTITTKRRGKRLQAQYSIKFVEFNRVK